jgi:mycoredoxin
MNTAVVILLLIIYGVLQNSDSILQWLNPPPAIINASEANDVILYSTTWCGYCAKTRKYLQANNIRFTEIDVEKTEQGRQDYARLGSGVPIVIINKNIFIRGYDPEKISAALTNTKTPAN